MKRNLLITKFIILLLCLTNQIVYAQSSSPFSINKSPLPKPTSPIMDYAGVLDSTTQKTLEKKVLDFRKKTNPPVEIGVAIIKTTDGRPIFDYSLAVARGWGIGSRGDDNPGVLLLVAIDDRKYFTQVSSDLEDELPDGLVGSLQRQYLVPQFKLQNYSKGIEDTINAYIKKIEERTSGEIIDVTKKTERSIPVNSDRFRGSSDIGFGELFICLIIIIIILFIIFANSGGGGSGGGGGRRRRRRSVGGDIAGDILSGIIGGVISGTINGGGGSSSGGWSSGGGSSGGWGGFGGGGDFGGGGAGGGW